MLPSMSVPANAVAALGLPAADVLDRQALARLQELDPGGKAGLVGRVLVAYTQSLQRLLEQLCSARESGDLHGQRHVAHTLKSSSASVGALQLSALCADVERRLREGPLEGLDAQFDALTEEGDRLLAAFGRAGTATP